jgi:hypothetical protein
MTECSGYHGIVCRAVLLETVVMHVAIRGSSCWVVAERATVLRVTVPMLLVVLIAQSDAPMLVVTAFN